MNISIIILITSVLGIISFFLSSIFSTYYFRHYNKKIIKEGVAVINGIKENKIQLDDGRILEVNKFIVPTEKEGVNMVIQLKGGKIEKIENAQNNQQTNKSKERLPKETFEGVEEDSRSRRKTSKSFRGFLKTIRARRR